MTSPGHVFCASPVFHAQHALGNHLASIRSHDVNSKNLICGLIRENLDESLRVARGIGSRARVGREWERSLIELHLRLLELLLRLSDRRNLGKCVNHSRNGIIIDVSGIARNSLYCCNALFFRLVREHGSIDAVANRVDGWHRCSKVRINIDPAKLISLNSQVFQTESISVWLTPSGYQNDIVILSFFVTSLRSLCGNSNRITHNLTLHHLRLELKLEPLLFQRRLEFLRHLLIHGRAKSVHELNHSHLRSETRPHRPHLKTNYSSSDNRHRLGYFLDVQRSSGVDDLAPRIIHGHGRQRRDLRSSRNDDILGVQTLAPAIVQRHAHAVRTRQAALSFEVIHLMLLEKMFDAAGQSLHGLGLRIKHFRNVHRHLSDVDSVIGKVMLRVMVVMGAGQQCLGWDAADIETSSAQRAAHFDACGFQAHLAGLDGGDVAAGSAADYHDVILFHGGGRGGKPSCIIRGGGSGGAVPKMGATGNRGSR
mmetsp:Transcript_11048/g.27175  ORF Transcript_11048/g.27175 Transcript_11048/m.27175 type:complete len:482 (-) Transcript_11048:59-1504(-)